MMSPEFPTLRITSGPVWDCEFDMQNWQVGDLPYSNARWAWARRVRSAEEWQVSFEKAAAAIMAALSVDSPGDGKKTGHGRRRASAALRKPVLQATPPETIKLREPVSSTQRAARRNNSSITVD